MSIPMKLFVDDERFPVDNTWDIARTFHEAIYLLERHEYTEISLDHDLACFYGNREMTGQDILNWLIARKMSDLHVPLFVHVHSQNPVGRDRMQEDIDRHFS